jgi:uncharacterized protein
MVDMAKLSGWRFLAGCVGIGLAGGMLGGLLGIGGGALIVPLVSLLLRVTQHQAHAISIAAIIPIAVAGALVFGEAHEVDFGGALLILLTSLPMARLGALWMRGMSESRLQIGFGILLLLMGSLMVLR